MPPLTAQDIQNQVYDATAKALKALLVDAAGLGLTEDPDDDALATTKDSLRVIGLLYAMGATAWARLKILGNADASGATITGNDSNALKVLSLPYKLVGTSTGDMERMPNVFKVVDAVAITAGTPAVLWTPASGKKVRLMGFVLSSSAAAALEFQDSGAAGTVIVQTPLLAAAQAYPPVDLRNGKLLAAANATLNLDVTATSTVSGMVWGMEE